MSHISASSATSRTLHRLIVQKDALSDEQLRQILQNGNTYAKDHAALLFAKKRTRDAVPWLMNAIQHVPDHSSLPTAYISALSDLTGQYFRTSDEWLTWWQNNQQAFQEKASQASNSNKSRETGEDNTR